VFEKSIPNLECVICLPEVRLCFRQYGTEAKQCVVTLGVWQGTRPYPLHGERSLAPLLRLAPISSPHEQTHAGASHGSQGLAAEFQRDTCLHREEIQLRIADTDMEKLQDPDSKQWRWGKLLYNLSAHPFAAIVDEATRAKINVGPIAKTGSEYVPNNSQYRDTDFRQMNGPSVRVMVDVGNWDNSRAVNHPGQSGDPDSPHYRDLAPMWRNGQYFPLLYTRKAVEKEAEKTIKLVPLQ